MTDHLSPKPKRTYTRDKPIPKAPEDVAHSLDVDKLRGELADVGVFPGTIYPTRNRKGYIVLTVDEVRGLLKQIGEARS